MFEEATKILLNSLGNEKVRLGNDEIFAASVDNLKISFRPEAVIFPEKDDDVAEVLKVANEFCVPVTIRASGTSTTGAATPICGGWALSFSKWNDIEIDEISKTATVRPGAIIQKINEAAAKFGLFFPPDPASSKFCSIGGNISTNAGGLRAAKYGVTRDYVLALEGFLANGKKVRWGARTKKFSAGYNLRDLWIGAEGTLGIITKATLKLIPLPEKKRTFLAAFSSDEAAIDGAISLLRERQISLSALEFMDALSISCALEEKSEQRGNAVFSRLKKGDSVLLAEVDGDENSVEKAARTLRIWAEKFSIFFEETAVPEEAETLWEVRKSCSPAMFRIANSKLNEDVVVPVENYKSLLFEMKKIEAETGLKTPIFGHAADGNFHVHVLFNHENPRERKLADTAVKSMMKKIVELGGAISGEHGIGLAKSPFLEVQFSEAEIDAMKAIKRALDPKNILGRGKIFEKFNVWEHETVPVKFPWERK